MRDVLRWFMPASRPRRCARHEPLKPMMGWNVLLRSERLALQRLKQVSGYQPIHRLYTAIARW